MNKSTARLIELSAKASGISVARAKAMYSKLPHHARSAFKDGMRRHLLSVAARTNCYEKDCSAAASPVPVIHKGEHGVIYACAAHKSGVSELPEFTVVPNAIEDVIVPADFVGMNQEDMKVVLEHDREKLKEEVCPECKGVPEHPDMVNSKGCLKCDFTGTLAGRIMMSEMEEEANKHAPCPNDTNGDGDCHLCHKAGGCEAFRARWEKVKELYPTPTPAPGTEEGDACNRDGCTGRMGHKPVENCSCHIAPPCGACESNLLTCLTCGANIEDDAGPYNPYENAPQMAD